MRKKQILIIVFLIILVCVVVLFGNSRKQNNETNDKENNGNAKIDSFIKYDEETALYYIEDEKTGNIIFASPNENDFQIYIDNPEYQPSMNPVPKTLEEYWMEYQTSIIEEME